MSKVLENKQTGEVIIWDESLNDYRQATEQETAVARKGALGQAASAVQGATGLVGLIDPETAQALETVNPLTSKAGLVGGLAAGGAGLARGAGRGLLSRQRATDRVQQAISQQSGGRFKTETGLLKRPSDVLPDVLENTGRALESGLESVPGLRLAGDAIKLQRQKVVTGRLSDALGVENQGGKLTREVLDSALTNVDNVYASARGELGRRLDRGSVKNLIESNPKIFGKETLEELAETEQNELGDFLIDLRSELRADQRQAKKLKDRKKLAKSIEKIQKIISDAVEGTNVKAELDEADRIYKLWKTIDTNSAIAPDGSVNYSTLRNALNRSYSSRAVKGGKGVNDPKVEALVKTLDELGQLGSPLPSSGTAERTIAAGMVGSALGVNLAQ